MFGLDIIPDFALPFLVAAHLCSTTGDPEICQFVLDEARRPELAVYVDGAALAEQTWGHAELKRRAKR